LVFCTETNFEKNQLIRNRQTQQITLVNKMLAHERLIVFLTYLFTLNPNMQSKFFHRPQFLYNRLFNYWFFGIFGIFISDFLYM